jgi:hypothetical protein
MDLSRGLGDVYKRQVNWYELRFDGKQPERRAHHTSFINEDKLYIYAG